MTYKIPVSVEILTLNNAGTIRDTLESVKDFDDILALDGGSTDGTLEILKSYGVRVLPQLPGVFAPRPITDFSAVRNIGLREAKHKWFLFIDSDEMLTPAICEEIRKISASERAQFYLWKVPRKYVIDGKVIDAATTYPNTQPRFFHRSHVFAFEKEVHEKIMPKPGVMSGTLSNYMLVPLLPRNELWKKWLKYLLIEEKRWEGMSRREALRKAINTFRPIILYGVRLPKVYLSRGQKMPIRYELLYQRYNFTLLFKLLYYLV